MIRILLPVSSLITYWLYLERLHADFQAPLAVDVCFFDPIEYVWILELLRDYCSSVTRPARRICYKYAGALHALLLPQLDMLEQFARLYHGVVRQSARIVACVISSVAASDFAVLEVPTSTDQRIMRVDQSAIGVEESLNRRWREFLKIVAPIADLEIVDDSVAAVAARVAGGPLKLLLLGSFIDEVAFGEVRPISVDS